MGSVNLSKSQGTQGLLRRLRLPVFFALTGAGTLGGAAFLSGTEDGRQIANQVKKATDAELKRLFNPDPDIGLEPLPQEVLETTHHQIEETRAEIFAQRLPKEYEEAVADVELPEWLPSVGIKFTLPTEDEFINKLAEQKNISQLEAIKKIGPDDKPIYQTLRQFYDNEREYLNAIIVYDDVLRNKFHQYLEENSAKYPELISRKLDYCRPLLQQVHSQLRENNNGKLSNKKQLMVYSKVCMEYKNALDGFRYDFSKEVSIAERKRDEERQVESRTASTKFIN